MCGYEYFVVTKEGDFMTGTNRQVRHASAGDRWIFFRAFFSKLYNTKLFLKKFSVTEFQSIHFLKKLQVVLTWFRKMLPQAILWASLSFIPVAGFDKSLYVCKYIPAYLKTVQKCFLFCTLSYMNVKNLVHTIIYNL